MRQKSLLIKWGNARNVPKNGEKEETGNRYSTQAIPSALLFIQQFWTQCMEKREAFIPTYLSASSSFYLIDSKEKEFPLPEYEVSNVIIFFFLPYAG